MIDPKTLSVHLHLFYTEPSIYLIDKISEYYNGDVYVSVNNEGQGNDTILSHAKTKFNKVHDIVVENRGNDQYGFFHSNKMSKSQTPWVFYAHDKTIKRIDWLDEILDPILSLGEKTLHNLFEDEENGIISSGSVKYKHKIMTEDDLTQLSKNKNFDSRLKIIQARHTLTWYRELQYILLTETGFINPEKLNPDFTAGNMFFIRRPILNMCHKCVHDSYFENYYREDGNVEHALERFYFYVSECMKYKNIFIEEGGNND